MQSSIVSDRQFSAIVTLTVNSQFIWQFRISSCRIGNIFTFLERCFDVLHAKMWSEVHEFIEISMNQSVFLKISVVIRSISTSSDNLNYQCDSHSMNETERELYLKLTIDKRISGSSNETFDLPSVDVGEASIIAVAKFRYIDERCIPIIDDEKGRMHVKEILNCDYLGCSADIFLDPFVISELGETDSTESIFNSLNVGGMRILEFHYEKVIGIIGEDLAKECNTLSKINIQFGIV